MVSMQAGAATAKRLFPLVGAEGTAALRLALSAAILAAIVRPWRSWPRPDEMPVLLGYGASLGAMNLLFYLALARVPLGIAVALEFTGPLCLAVVLSRRSADFAWTLLAAAGLLLLLPFDLSVHALDPVGMAFAVAAGACWAAYSVLGQKAGDAHGAATASMGIAIAAVLIVPFGVAHAGSRLWVIDLLPAALVVAVFSSALPFSLEMVALTRMPTRVYGTLSSLEPAIGALAGFAFLGETLTTRQVLAIAMIMGASLGTAATATPLRKVPPPS